MEATLQEKPVRNDVYTVRQLNEIYNLMQVAGLKKSGTVLTISKIVVEIMIKTGVPETNLYNTLTGIVTDPEKVCDSMFAARGLTETHKTLSGKAAEQYVALIRNNLR